MALRLIKQDINLQGMVLS